MRRFLVLLPLLLLSLPARADLKVVATVPDLAAIAKEVGGEKAKVSALALPTQDAHFVDARPSLALELARADLLLAIGLELEVGWLPPLQTGSRNGKILRGSRGYLEVFQFVKLLDVPPTQVDRSMGDVHPGGNPHFLMDIRSAVPVAQGIAQRMTELDPQNAQVYADNLKAFEAKVQKAQVDFDRRLATLKGQPAIGYHMSLSYLAQWLGLQMVAYLEPKPGIPPNPSHAAEVLARGKQAGVKLVVQEEFYPENISRVVAERLQAKLVKLPGGTRFREGQTYLEHIGDFVKAFEQARPAQGPVR